MMKKLKNRKIVRFVASVLSCCMVLCIPSDITFAYTARTADQALDAAAAMYRWKAVQDPFGDWTYRTGEHCSTCYGAGDTSSKNRAYFARWEDRATCTSGGSYWISCSNHETLYGCAALGHSPDWANKSWEYKNDGYWYVPCYHCAEWTKSSAITYYVNYNDTHISGNSTSGTMDKTTHTFGSAATLRINAFEKRGADFLGWATSPTGDVVYTDGQSVSNLTTTHGGVVELYAVWKMQEFDLTYDANGGVIDGTTDSALTIKAEAESEIDLSLKALKDGLNFIGWSLSSTAENVISSMTMPLEEVTLYALYSIPVSDMKKAELIVWNKNDKDVYNSFDMNLDSVNEYKLHHYSLKEIVANEGINFDVEEDLEWNILLYDNAGNMSLLFMDEGKADIPNIPQYYRQTVNHHIWDLERQEYHYLTSSGGEDVRAGDTYTPSYLDISDEKYPIGYAPSSIDAAYIVEGHTTTSAYYNPVEYKLAFDPNGGTCDTTEMKAYYGYAYNIVDDFPTAYREGYDFLGWYENPTDGAEVTSSSIHTVDGNRTIYAHWKVHSHNVTYDYWTNGGDSVSKMTDVVDYGSHADLSVEAEKNGWEFVGWNTNPDATTGMTEYVMQDNDTVLYAIFKKDLTATFIDKNDTDYVTRVVSTTIYGANEQGSITIPSQNEVSGWSALGWATGMGANAEIMAFSNTTIPIVRDTTYYGMYSKEITLSYNTKDSAWELPSVTKEGFFNASGDYSYPTFDIEAAPMLDNHSFVAWVELNENNEVISSYEAGTTKVFEKDIVLTETWDKFPEIEAYDRYFTLEEVQNGSITADKLLETVIARDKEDGLLQNGTSVTVKGFDTLDFLAGEEVEVTYEAVDSFGNTVTKTITVHVVDTTVSISPIIRYTRFISKEFYSDDENLYDADKGGLEDTSIWRTDESYKRLIESSLFNTKINEEYKIIDKLGLNEQIKVAGSGEWEHLEETWEFNREEIEDVKEFVNEHGYGDIKEDGAIDKFLELFGGCKK